MLLTKKMKMNSAMHCLCECHNQVVNSLTKNQFLTGASVDAVAQCLRTLKINVVGDVTVLLKQGASANYVWMLSICRSVQRILHTSAMMDKTAVVVLFAKLPIAIIF